MLSPWEKGLTDNLSHGPEQLILIWNKLIFLHLASFLYSLKLFHNLSIIQKGNFPHTPVDSSSHKQHKGTS